MTKQALRAFLLLACVFSCAASQAVAQASAPCANVPHSDHPKTVLTNSELQALVFLPDTTSGYYRSTRFDWAGVIGCIAYKGHTFWGEWFSKYDPLLNDSITGPVEEFRSEDGGLGYADAKPGDPFVKVGVGVLRRVDDSPYKFGVFYPILDTGKWKVHTTKRSVTFRHTLKSSIGYSYVYTKTLRLDKQGSVIALEHTLKNTGSKTIDTNVYDHDFFMLDNRPTGPGMFVKFPFTPKLDSPQDRELDPELARIDGNTVRYLKELQKHQTVSGYVTGYSDKAADYNITVQDDNTGIGVQQTSDSPIARFYLWSIRSTISPEAYIHLHIEPKQSQSWKIEYRFFTR